MRRIERQQWYAIAGVVALIALLPLYYFYDPQGGGFPACPFYQLTGLFCTGCGSQRALHDLLHLDLGSSLGHNLLLAPALVLIGWHLAAVTWDWKRNGSPLNALYAPHYILGVVVVFTVVRNLPWEPFSRLSP